MRALVAGWFSFEDGHATAGDLLARDLVCAWLRKIECDYDIATDPPFQGGVNWRTADPGNYDYVVFVCGPFEQGENERQFLRRFWNCRLLGLNLSMQLALDEWNPFDLLVERDSSRRVHADLVFRAARKVVPVVGICLVEDYPKGQTEIANAAISRLIGSREIATVPIDTRLDVNSTGLRTPAEVESFIARVDVIITTRLHAMVMALRNGVPVVAIDPEAGGAKIVRQGMLIGWPLVFPVDAVTDIQLENALEYCLTATARQEARECAERAAAHVDRTEKELLRVVSDSAAIDARRTARLSLNAEFPDWVHPLRPEVSADSDRRSEKIRQVLDGLVGRFGIRKT